MLQMSSVLQLVTNFCSNVESVDVLMCTEAVNEIIYNVLRVG